DRAHTHALVQAPAALLDDAVLEHPALVTAGLEVKIGGVHARRHQLAKHPLKVPLGQAGGLQYVLAYQLQIVSSSIGHAIPHLRSGGVSVPGSGGATGAAPPG